MKSSSDVPGCIGFTAQLNLKKENRVSVTQKSKAEDAELYRLGHGVDWEVDYRVMAVGCPGLIPDTWTLGSGKPVYFQTPPMERLITSLPGSGVAQPLGRAVPPG